MCFYFHFVFPLCFHKFPKIKNEATVDKAEKHDDKKHKEEHKGNKKNKNK